jgi:hypothetical protein
MNAEVMTDIMNIYLFVKYLRLMLTTGLLFMPATLSICSHFLLSVEDYEYTVTYSVFASCYVLYFSINKTVFYLFINHQHNVCCVILICRPLHWNSVTCIDYIWVVQCWKHQLVKCYCSLYCLIENTNPVFCKLHSFFCFDLWQSYSQVVKV